MINLDATVQNGDWIKLGQWDIPANNPVELHAYLDGIGMSVADFKSLPVYKLNQHRLSWLAAFGQEVPNG